MNYTYQGEQIRFDIYLLSQLGDLTRSHIKNLIVEGKAIVNGNECKTGV